MGLKEKQLEDEFEEFDDGEDDDEDENGTTIPADDDEEEEEEEEVKKPVKKILKPIQKPEVREATKEEPQVQYVGVPRAVTNEEMLNRIFDEIQELKQMVDALMKNG